MGGPERLKGNGGKIPGIWRRRRESNPLMVVLQTTALPFGYPAAVAQCVGILEGPDPAVNAAAEA